MHMADPDHVWEHKQIEKEILRDNQSLSLPTRKIETIYSLQVCRDCSECRIKQFKFDN